MTKIFDFTDVEIASRMVAENELAFAFLNKMPILPGHTLICPKKQVALSEQLTSETWSDLLKLKEIVCLKLRRILYARGFNFAWNEETIAGQTVPHFHLHVVPRKETDIGITEYEPRVFLYRPGSRATSPSHELITLSKELRELA
jgi:histidine triad (HIT) family protein